MALSWYAVPVQPASQEPPPARPFDIPAGPLVTVVEAFERDTGIHVTFASPDIGTVRSPGVSGLLTPADALAQLLTGTGVGYTFTTPLAVALEVKGIAESIDVTATQPRVASARYTRPVSETPQTIRDHSAAGDGSAGRDDAQRGAAQRAGHHLQAGEGGGASSTTGDMFNLRGFSANNSLFVDGVRDDGLISRDVFNLEQVEVFMGPTGTDVGRGTAAGYVNMHDQVAARAIALRRYVRDRHVRAEAGDRRPQPGAALRRAGIVAGGGSAVRLNALVQDSGVPGRDSVEHESARRRAVARARSRHPHTPRARRRSSSSRTTSPTTVSRLRPGPRGRCADHGQRRRPPVEQDNYYGSPDHDYDSASQDSYFGRARARPRLAASQLRQPDAHNKTHRTAVISAIQSPASYNPATEVVTIARQGNERENRVTSNQTTLTAVGRTGAVRHALTGRLELTKESQFAPTLIGIGHA